MSDKTERPLSLKCPTCGKTIFWTDEYPYRPFCSERCKLIDLGAWAAEEYRIPSSTPPDLEDFEEDVTRH